MSPRETTTSAMLHEDDDDDSSRMQSSVASSAATVQALTGILEDSNKTSTEEKPAEATRRPSVPKKKFPTNEPRNLRRGSANKKLGATRKTLNGKIRNRSPHRHSTGSIVPIAEGEVSNAEGGKKAERRKSNDSASIGLPGRGDRSWQGWAEVSETSSGWSDVYQDDDDSLEDFDELDGQSLPFVDEAEGIIEKPIILDKPDMKRSQSAPQEKDKEDKEETKPKQRTKSSGKKSYSALDDDEVDQMNSSGFSVAAIMRRSHSVPPKVEVPETPKPQEKPGSKEKLADKSEKKDAERKARVEKKMQDAIQTGLHDSSSSLFSVSAFLRRSHSVPPKIEAPGEETTKKNPSDETSNKQASKAKQSTKKLNKSGKLQESSSSNLMQGLKKLAMGSAHKDDAKAEESAAARRAQLNKIRGRSSNRKLTNSAKPQEPQSSQSSKPSLPKNKERRSHSVPSQVEQPEPESLLKEPQTKASKTSLSRKLRGRSSNRKVATSSKSSKMGESHSSGLSSSSKTALPRPDKTRRSHSVPTEVEEPKMESLLPKETQAKPERASPDKLRGRSSNRKVATSSSKPSKMDESQSSGVSHSSSKKSLPKSSMRRSQSVPSEVEDKVPTSEADTPKMANKTSGTAKDRLRGQSSARKTRMQDSSSTGFSANSKKSTSKSSRRSHSVPSQKDLPKGEEPAGVEKPKPSSKERIRDRSKAKKLSSSGRLDDSYSTMNSKKSVISKESRKRSQSVPSQKDLPKNDESGGGTARPSSKERARTKKLSKSGRLEDSQSTGLSLSSHKSHKTASSKRSQSVPARKDNSESGEAEEEQGEKARRATASKTKYPTRKRDSPVADRTYGRAQSLSTLRSRNTALNMFNKSAGSSEPLEHSFREDETRRMVKEAGFLEASEYIGNTRSKSLGRSLHRSRDSVGQEPKIYFPPNLPRDRSGRRWSLTEKAGDKAQTEVSESIPSTSRPKLSKAAAQKQRRARSHSVQRRSRGEELFSNGASKMLSAKRTDEADKNDSGQNLFENSNDLLDKIKEDSSLSMTDRWETIPNAIPFPEAEFPEPEWDNSKLHASDGKISTSCSRASSSKASDKKHKSESNLNTSRKGRKSPKGERIKDSAQRKRQSSQSRSRSRPHADKSRLDDAVKNIGLVQEESTFHRSADYVITPKNDSESSEDEISMQRPKARTTSTRLVALYGGTRVQGDSDHGTEKVIDNKSRRSGGPKMNGTDDFDTGLYDGSGEGELAVQSETGPRLRYASRQTPNDRVRDRESMKRDGRNRLAKERNRPIKNHEDEELEDNYDNELSNKSDGELARSDGELSLEKSPSRDSWGVRKKPSGRNPQQQQRNRRDTVSQDMLHQSVTSIPSLESIQVEKPSQPSSGTQMQPVKEQPWQRRRRLSIGGEDQ